MKNPYVKGGWNKNFHIEKFALRKKKWQIIFQIKIFFESNLLIF